MLGRIDCGLMDEKVKSPFLLYVSLYDIDFPSTPLNVAISFGKSRFPIK
jgi:hypothetical protein